MILSLDIATKSGFCLWDTVKNKPRTAGIINSKIRTKATKTLEADHLGKRLFKLDQSLNKIFQYVDSSRNMPPIELISYERITMGVRAGGRTAAVARHLEAIVIHHAFTIGVPIMDFATGTVKKFATGNGNALKEDMMTAAEETWPDFINQLVDNGNYDDNVADAIWVAALTANKL